MPDNVHDSILGAIGRTPLVRLNRIVRDVPATVCAKLETFNPGHSIKDRMAVKMIEDAERKGLLKPGGTIIEGTSGNTGMGLAIAAIVKGYRCIFTTTDKQSKEKIDALRAFGAEVIVCPTDVAPEDPRSYYSVSSRLERETPDAWKANQYDNLSNTQAHYETTGPEIWEQTEGRIDHLVVGVGTGGTICGVGKYLKERKPRVKIWKSCSDRVAGFSPDGTQMMTFHILTDGLGPGEIRLRTIGGTKLATYTSNWFSAWGFDWLYDRLFRFPYLWFTRVNAKDGLDVAIGFIPTSLRAMHGALARTQTGDEAILNYRMNGSWIIVDGLFERGELVTGVGRSRKTVKITNRGFARAAGAR